VIPLPVVTIPRFIAISIGRSSNHSSLICPWVIFAARFVKLMKQLGYN
jgi:hypothetical protein